MRTNGRIPRTAARFMAGRCGVDSFTRFLTMFSLFPLLLSVLTRRAGTGRLSSFFLLLTFALLLWGYFRMFSRNLPRRQAENARYLQLRYRAASALRTLRDCFRQRKDYAFYRCPGCHNIVRVPRGKGKLRITCRRCGYSFNKKT